MDKKQMFAQVVMDAIREGWFVGSNHKEGCSSITFKDGVYSYYAGWGGGELRKTTKEPAVFLAFLVEEAYLREVRHCVEGYLGSLGLQAMDDKRWSQAHHYFEQAINLNYTLSYTGHALLLAAQGRIDEGQQVLQQIDSLIKAEHWRYDYDGFYRMFLDRSVAHHGDQRHQDMLRYWELLLSLDPVLPDALMWRGWAHFNVEEQEKARRDYKQAISLFTTTNHQRLKQRAEDFLSRIGKCN